MKITIDAPKQYLYQWSRGQRLIVEGVPTGTAVDFCHCNEDSFHTNTRATNWLMEEKNLDKLAKAEAKVIAKYYGMYTKEEEMKKYNTIDEIPNYGKPTVQKLMDAGALKGNDTGLDLSEDMLRMLTINDRAGLYDHLQRVK